MKEFHCPLCKGKMINGVTDLTIRKGKSVVVIEQIPAVVCEQCGEASIDAQTSQKVYVIAERELERGEELEFLKYVA